MLLASRCLVRRIWIGLAFLLLAGPDSSLAEAGRPTARGIFSLLPPSIFENTPEGLSETSKEELLRDGRSQFWEIVGETPDTLVFAELPFRDRSVGLRLFHNAGDGSTDIALGTLGDPMCTVELWRMDRVGRIVPVDTPPEPSIQEFYRKRAAKRNGQTVLVCLGEGGLKAVPVIWDKAGFRPLNADNEINFIWNGSRFEKKLRPVAKCSTQKRHRGTSSE